MRFDRHGLAAKGWIVSRGFTPRAIGSLRETLTARAEQIAAAALARGSGDFVSEVACENLSEHAQGMIRSTERQEEKSRVRRRRVASASTMIQLARRTAAGTITRR